MSIGLYRTSRLRQLSSSLVRTFSGVAPLGLRTFSNGRIPADSNAGESVTAE
jgi:hypothetical protein